MQIRLAHTTDAAAVNELLHQLGYAQDGTATTATRIQTWGDDPSAQPMWPRLTATFSALSRSTSARSSNAPAPGVGSWL